MVFSISCIEEWIIRLGTAPDRFIVKLWQMGVLSLHFSLNLAFKPICGLTTSLSYLWKASDNSTPLCAWPRYKVALFALKVISARSVPRPKHSQLRKHQNSPASSAHPRGVSIPALLLWTNLSAREDQGSIIHARQLAELGTTEIKRTPSVPTQQTGRWNNIKTCKHHNDQITIYQAPTVGSQVPLTLISRGRGRVVWNHNF